MEFVKTLKEFCTADTATVFKHLKQYGFKTHTAKKQRFAFRYGATLSSPLVVCHADTVVDGGNGKHPFSYKDGIAKSIALDDRLGITLMTHLIDSSMMADCAFLVCDDEEIGISSARVFDKKISPNWMVELDRRGTDAVMYKYETPILGSMLEACGFTVGRGTFSDICELDHLGCAGFNIGVGYHSEHSDNCHANLVDSFAQIEKLLAFYDRFNDLPLPYEAYVDTSYTRTSYTSTSYTSYHDDIEDTLMDDIRILEDAVARGRVNDLVISVYDRYGYNLATEEPDFVLSDLRYFAGL